ncbi:hypothetical protein SpCBS45565_g03490 [Spizellomyces sp. 'palustris']|nr:hypothetical protein SpCBS45565_g03490 [Spizellomyces sp. 'palustris']
MLCSLVLRLMNSHTACHKLMHFSFALEQHSISIAAFRQPSESCELSEPPLITSVCYQTTGNTPIQSRHYEDWRLSAIWN